MRTIHLNEIIPEKLYQRGQFITFPWAAKMAMLERHEIDVVVNLWARPDPELHTKQGLIYIHWPIGGGEPPYPKWPIIACLDEYMSAGRRVLVHCEAGVNRSIWLASLLSAIQLGISGNEAFERLQEKTGRVKVRAGLLADLPARIARIPHDSN